MGRSSTKQKHQPSKSSGFVRGPATVLDTMADPAAIEARIEYLMKPSARISWEEFREKHKEQLNDRMGDGIERESKKHREVLDEERRLKLGRGINHHPGIDDAKGKKKRKKSGKDSDSDDDYGKKKKPKGAKGGDGDDGEIFRLSDFRKGGGDYAKDEESDAGSGSASPVPEWLKPLTAEEKARQAMALAAAKSGAKDGGGNAMGGGGELAMMQLASASRLLKLVVLTRVLQAEPEKASEDADTDADAGADAGVGSRTELSQQIAAAAAYAEAAATAAAAAAASAAGEDEEKRLRGLLEQRGALRPLAKGDACCYRDKSGALVPAKVTSVDVTISPPSYQVYMQAQDRYVETERHRLVLEGEEGEEPAVEKGGEGTEERRGSGRKEKKRGKEKKKKDKKDKKKDKHKSKKDKHKSKKSKKSKKDSSDSSSEEEDSLRNLWDAQTGSALQGQRKGRGLNTAFKRFAWALPTLD